MNTYECVKDKLIFMSKRWKRGELLNMESDPCDGKGNSLLDGDPRRGRTPAFRLIKSDTPTVSNAPRQISKDLQEAAKKDPRERKEIRDDILKNYGEQVDHRMSKINLIALETKLKMLNDKDATTGEIGMNDPMTLQQAQDLVR